MKKIILLTMSIGLCIGCQTEKAIAPETNEPPAALKITKEETPVIIKIARTYIVREGRSGELRLESAAVKSQDCEAYYISVKRKGLASRQPGDAVVKVYKSDGRAEWANE
jgi:hypothetical protein